MKTLPGQIRLKRDDISAIFAAMRCSNSAASLFVPIVVINVIVPTPNAPKARRWLPLEMVNKGQTGTSIQMEHLPPNK
jgi:hypothetical protein